MKPAETLNGPAVVAYTSEDDEHGEVRQAAAVHASEHGCVVILYDVDAASAFSEPMPNQWASEGEGERFGDRLNANDLDFLGRSSLARQVREMQAGIRVGAWLPNDRGPGALVDYAAEQGAHAVFVPAKLDSIDEISERLAGEPSPKAALERPAIELHVVPSRPQESVRR